MSTGGIGGCWETSRPWRVAGRVVRSRTTLVCVLLCLVGVGVWVYQYRLGRRQARIVYVDDPYRKFAEWVRGKYMPPVTWRSMQTRGTVVVEFTTPLFSRKRTEVWCTGRRGDWLIATGPEGIGVARVPPYFLGCFRTALFLSHGTALVAAVTLSLCLGVLLSSMCLCVKKLAALWRRPRPGHCETCGYNLYGLPTNRCPECGNAFG
jgi:hypothetical protein